MMSTHTPLTFSYGPACRSCGQPISGEQWANAEPCPGPIELYEVISNLASATYLGTERRMQLATLVRRVVKRIETP